MKSFVTFAVEHGEDTDPLEAFITMASGLDEVMEGFSIIDHTVKVDVSLDEVLAGLTWDQRATLESGKPLPVSVMFDMAGRDMEGDRENDAFFDEAFRADPKFEAEYGSLYDTTGLAYNRESYFR